MSPPVRLLKTVRLLETLEYAFVVDIDLIHVYEMMKAFQEYFHWFL